MPDNIIDIVTLQADIDATERLRNALLVAAEEAGERILSLEGRAQLIAALVPGVGPGWRLAWSPVA